MNYQELFETFSKISHIPSYQKQENIYKIIGSYGKVHACFIAKQQFLMAEILIASKSSQAVIPLDNHRIAIDCIQCFGLIQSG